MSELNVVAVLTAKPGSEQVVQDALEGLVAPTQAEPGNVAYALYRSAADPAVFITIEKWASQADLDAHMQTPHIGQALTIASDHLAAAPAIHPLVPVA
ncbi:MAG: antibiotic biosynthesis monooxygenase [Actinomycetota bacterium]|nr:antibiotic biosynthesis monooxygenase [Actinomycetota bacterium]